MSPDGQVEWEGFGVGLAFGMQTLQSSTWPEMCRRWARFEAMGWHSLWLPDHFLPTFRRELPMFEAWTLLAGLAPATSTARIGVLVSCNTFRHPALLAKQAATVDHISGGRLEVGLGAGWVEWEHEMYGLRYPDAPERVALFGEALEMLNAALREEVVSHAGEHFALKEAQFRPAPVQRPRPPLTLAAHSPKMLRLIAPHVDRWNSMGSPDELRERSERLTEALVKIDRDPETVIRSALYVPMITPAERPWASVEAFVDFAGRYQEAGLTEIILQPPPDEQGELFGRISSEVLPSLAS